MACLSTCQLPSLNSLNAAGPAAWRSCVFARVHTSSPCLPSSAVLPQPAGELRWDEVRAGRDLHVIDGLTVTKMSNEGGDYATVLGTLCVASGQHSWNVYINHVEDSNLFIGVTMGGHDLNADPQEMKSRTYYLSNGTIRVAGAQQRGARQHPPLPRRPRMYGSSGLRAPGNHHHTPFMPPTISPNRQAGDALRRALRGR